MGQWTLPSFSGRRESLYGYDSSGVTGVSVISGSSTQPGSWAEVSSGLPYAANGFFFSISEYSWMRFDLGIGESGSQVELARNFFSVYRSSRQAYSHVPIRIPANQRVWVRGYDGGSNTVKVTFNAAPAGFHEPNVCTTSWLISQPIVGDSSNRTWIGSGTVMNNDRLVTNAMTWYEIEDSMPLPTTMIGLGIDSVWGDRYVYFEIGVGASGYEQTVANLYYQSLNASDYIVFPCRIPAGSRVCVRGKSRSTIYDDFGFYLTGYL